MARTYAHHHHYAILTALVCLLVVGMIFYTYMRYHEIRMSDAELMIYQDSTLNPRAIDATLESTDTGGVLRGFVTVPTHCDLLDWSYEYSTITNVVSIFFSTTRYTEVCSEGATQQPFVVMMEYSGTPVFDAYIENEPAELSITPLVTHQHNTSEQAVTE